MGNLLTEAYGWALAFCLNSVFCWLDYRPVNVDPVGAQRAERRNFPLAAFWVF